MKFIFPQNYNFSSKFLGIIDYSTAIINVIWFVFIFCILNILLSSLKIKIFLFIILCMPVLIFSVVGFNHENILYVIFYIFKFLNSPKLYLYK